MNVWSKAFFSGVLVVVLTSAAKSEDWPRFRGPSGQGMSSETNLPINWSKTENVAWKTAVPGEGWSSPVISGDRVFVTSTTEEGRSCHVICLDRRSGKILWNTKVFEQVISKKRDENSYATPTPTTDGRCVYAVFSSGKMAAVDFEGEVKWVNPEVKFYSHHGLAASPILFQDLVIMAYDGSSDGENNKVGWKIPWDQAVLLAVDKASGKVRWRGKRGLSRLAHVTPNLLRSSGSDQIISGAGDAVQGFDPADGRLIWSIYSKGEGVTPSIVVGDGQVFSCSGFEDPTIRVIRPDGKGDVTDSHIVWEQKKGVPSLASMLYVKPHLYSVSEKGVVTCFQAASGEIVWQDRIGGKHSSSPIYADGKIYFLSEAEGESVVIQAGPELKILARNRLDEKCKASMAASQGNLFIRSEQHVFCIGKRPAERDRYSLNVVADREDALYRVGEEATFLITLQAGAEPVRDGTVSYVIDNFLHGGEAAGLPQGNVSLGNQPARVVVKARRPGFLRCQVTYQPSEGKPLRAVASAGFSPTEIKPSLPVPDDFDEFWADQKRALAEVPIDAKLTSVEHLNDSIECFDVQVPCLGGAPVSGYYAKPKAAAAKSLPAILWVHGAGVRSSSLPNAVKGAQAGMLSMDINAHGIANGKPLAFYAKTSSGPLKNYRHAGREHRDTIYFRGMFLRLVRAIDFLTAQPEWNGREVVVIGHSQGGGQSLVAGGLDDRVTMIAPGVPAICDHSGQVAGRVNGWPKLVPNGTDGKPEPQVLEASRYVDAVNFASRCRAEAIMSVGFIDAVCPPSSCYAAYNALLGKKTMINEPLMGHAAPDPIKNAFFDRVLKHVNLQPAEQAK